MINIGSIDGLRTPSVENYSYSASKAAVHMLTRHLAKRLAAEQHHRQRDRARAVPEQDDGLHARRPGGARSAVEGTVPLRRIGRPDDVAGLILFLCSRAGSYLTGTVIPLDGGITGCG